MPTVLGKNPVITENVVTYETLAPIYSIVFMLKWDKNK
jgi:hypothetical protein